MRLALLYPNGGTTFDHNKLVRRTEVGRFADSDGLTRIQSGLLGGGILVVATLLSRFGIIALVAQGYTIMAYFFIALFAVPTLTIGIIRIVNPDWKHEFWARA